MTDRIRVLVVEDHEVMAEGLRDLLGDYPDLVAVGVVNTVAGAVAAVGSGPPDVVLMDYRLSDGDGVTAAALIRASHPDVRVVFLSADDGQAAREAAREAGAAAYLTKPDAMLELADVVRRVAGGERLL